MLMQSDINIDRCAKDVPKKTLNDTMTLQLALLIQIYRLSQKKVYGSVNGVKSMLNSHTASFTVLD